MARAITDEQRAQWSAVHRQALVLAEFFDRKDLPLAAAIRQAAEPAHPFASRLAGLREALADLLEMSANLPPGDLRKLDHHVRAELGLGLDELQTGRLARIQEVRNRGKIKTDEQFRLLKGRHEQIWDDPSHSEEANALAALLDQYEARKVRRKAPPNNGLQQTWPSLRSVHAAETWYVSQI
jgi:hypothetical protein